jgi:hypothetical protein
MVMLVAVVLTVEKVSKPAGMATAGAALICAAPARRSLALIIL